MTLLRRGIGFISLLLGIGAIWFLLRLEGTTSQSSMPELTPLGWAIVWVMIIWLGFSAVNKMGMIANNPDPHLSFGAVICYFILVLLVVLNSGSRNVASVDDQSQVIILSRIIITLVWPIVDMFEAVYQKKHRHPVSI